ncbi:MAG: hypothetical protein ACI9UV_000594 [Algoriphagus sp.]|jgi:hypothetical protein
MLSFLFGAFLFTSSVTQIDTLTNSEKATIHSFLTEKKALSISEDFQFTTTTELNLLITSADGLKHATTVLGYDRLNEIVNFELEVTDPISQKTLHRAKLKDMSDFSAYSTMSIFDDNRYKRYVLKSGEFPIQVTIKTEVMSKTNFFLPDWIPVHHYNQKVVSSTFEVDYPATVGLRTRELNLLGEKSKADLAGQTRMTWIEKDLPIQEPDLKEEEDHRLLLAPIKFGMESFVGTMDNWSGLASFLTQLNENRNDLPEEFKASIRKMTANSNSTFEKIDILYSYLQRNYRYVSIQLGIGGWQSMKTSDVVKYAYGDCKALTFLMQSMLAEVGIESHYTLVFAGQDEDDIEVEFPSNQFNHVILQAIDGDQPVWLECTSNTLPAGYLGDFTKNRHVLVTNKTGGYLTKTPDYKGLDWNTAKSYTSIEIDAAGNAKIKTNQSFQGNPAGDLIYLKTQLDSRQQRDYFNKNSPVSGLIIEELKFDLDKRDSIPLAEVSYEGVIQRFTQNTSKRVILRPFMDKISKSILEMGSLSAIDDYVITLAEAMEPEFELQNQTFKEKGIQIQLNHSFQGNELTVTRKINYMEQEELDEESKSELVKKINLSLSKSYIFIKPTLSEK